jgi:23S rRNA (uridine2552-2'-O)-methyltransferase
VARRVLHDRFFRLAQSEGYRARSAYKLREIAERRRLLRPGQRVLDLGCAPGSWLQIASELVGPSGVVVGIDLQAIQPGLPPNVRAFTGDITSFEAQTLTSAAGGLFDAVLSDMAPNTTGAGDHFRSERLCRAVLDLLPALLRPGGSLVMKVFEGEKYPALLRDTAHLFGEAKGFKPQASRDVSREIYIIATHYRPAPTSALRAREGNRATPERA